MNYDEYASTFDQRYAAQPYAGVREALTRLVADQSIGHALEVGCGTGHWLRELDQQPGVKAIGIDVSYEMLRRAERGHRICGSASDLPIAAAACDLVYCVNALHHFPRAERFIAEARRALRPGGMIAIIGLDPHQASTQWYLYEHFDGVEAWDRQRYRPAGQIAASLEAAGFERVTSAAVERIGRVWHGAEVWRDPFLEKRSTSQLMALSERDYASGLERIQRTIDAASTPPAFVVRLTLMMTVGARTL